MTIKSAEVPKKTICFFFEPNNAVYNPPTGPQIYSDIWNWFPFEG